MLEAQIEHYLFSCFFLMISQSFFFHFKCFSFTCIYNIMYILESAVALSCRIDGYNSDSNTRVYGYSLN